MLVYEKYKVFENHPNIHEVISVIGAEHDEIYRSRCAVAKKTRVVFGGEDRQSSVKNALDELSKDKPDFVIIHDALGRFSNPKFWKPSSRIFLVMKLSFQC